MPRCSSPGPTGSCSTARRSIPGAAASRPTTACCSGAGCRPASPGRRKGDEHYLIPAEGDPLPPPGTAVRGAVEDDRRTALMRTHSGLHVLCGVVFRDYGSLVTGGNMEPFTARMDFDLPELPAGFREAVEAACNAEIAAGRRIDVRVLPRSRRARHPRHHPHGHQPRPARRQGRPHHRHRRASISRRTAARTSPRPARSARSRSPRSRTRARASVACGSGSPTSPVSPAQSARSARRSYPGQPRRSYPGRSTRTAVVPPG